MRIALFGDVVGRPGRTILLANLPKIKAALQADFCVVNAENAAGGSGLTVDIAKQLLSGGVDVITLGDHAFRQKDYHEMLALNRVAPPTPPAPRWAWDTWRSSGRTWTSQSSIFRARLSCSPRRTPSLWRTRY